MADLKYDELCNLIALEVGGHATINSVKRYLKAIYKVILSQLELRSRIYFKGFGYWEIKDRKSGEREITDFNTGERKLIYVKPRKSIFFKATENFETSVNEGNFKILSNKGTKREKKLKGDKRRTQVDLINKANSRAKKIERS